MTSAVRSTTTTALELKSNVARSSMTILDHHFIEDLTYIVDKEMSQPHVHGCRRMFAGTYKMSPMMLEKFLSVQSIVRIVAEGKNSFPSVTHENRLRILRVAATMGMAHHLLEWAGVLERRSSATGTMMRTSIHTSEQLRCAYWDAACCIDEVGHELDVLHMEILLDNTRDRLDRGLRNLFRENCTLWMRVHSEKLMRRVFRYDMIHIEIIESRSMGNFHNMMQNISMEVLKHIVVRRELEKDLLINDAMLGCFQDEHQWPGNPPYRLPEFFHVLYQAAMNAVKQRPKVRPNVGPTCDSYQFVVHLLKWGCGEMAVEIIRDCVRMKTLSRIVLRIYGGSLYHYVPRHSLLLKRLENYSLMLHTVVSLVLSEWCQPSNSAEHMVNLLTSEIQRLVEASLLSDPIPLVQQIVDELQLQPHDTTNVMAALTKTLEVHPVMRC